MRAAEQTSGVAKGHPVHGFSYWRASAPSVYRTWDKVHDQAETVTPLLFCPHTTLTLSIPPDVRKKQT